ncbi:MAG: M20/M25/M40 family metallo-hydrolase [Deltaproteobacteria bacterium]|nr:M20/M25/M40 family metallo-hydrolase [Deltaproteobacteria bacterium]
MSKKKIMNYSIPLLLLILFAISFTVVTQAPAVIDRQNQPTNRTATTPCSATLSSDQKLQIPYVLVNGQPYSVSFGLSADAGGQIQIALLSWTHNLTPYSCPPGSFDSKNMVLYVPDIVYNAVSYWAIFKYQPTSDGQIWFKLSAASPNGPGSQVLARVEVPGYLQDLNLPVYADLEDGAGTYYALVVAPQALLQVTGVPFKVIDQFTPGTNYMLGQEDTPGARQQAAKITKVLYDDGRNIIVRYNSGLADTLGDLGFEMDRLNQTPMILFSNETEDVLKDARYDKNPTVDQLIGKITETDVKTFISNLSGETAVTVNGAVTTIDGRQTESTNLKLATQYVLDQLKAMNLTASFDDWSATDDNGAVLKDRNVIGEITGKTKPGEIIILVAHLDSLPSKGRAPGADDDASGCAALLAGAKAMSSYSFQRTIRFVFSTGEEDGIFGSKDYANKVKAANQNIVAVINLDMISYNFAKTAPSKQNVKTRNSKNTLYNSDLNLAQVYLNVVKDYGLTGTITPVHVPDNDRFSDQSSFWDKGYAAIWIIEDDSAGGPPPQQPWNPYYHSTDDKLANMDMTYCTAMVKATAGTAATLAVPSP